MKTGCMLTALLSIFLFTHCRKDVYKQDAQYADLPAYSKKGLNIGGCFINDTAWLMPKRFLSRTKNLYIFSYPAGDSLVLFFNGRFKEDSLQYRPPHTFFLVLKNIKISSDTGLLALRNQSFKLDGVTTYGGFARGFDLEKPRSATGSITFDNIVRQDKIIYGDGSPGHPKLNPYILAGRFEINITTDRNYTLSKGRFDLTVLKDAEFYVTP